MLNKSTPVTAPSPFFTCRLPANRQPELANWRGIHTANSEGQLHPHLLRPCQAMDRALVSLIKLARTEWSQAESQCRKTHAFLVVDKQVSESFNGHSFGDHMVTAEGGFLVSRDLPT